CEAEEPHHVRVGAEAAVPHADSVLGRQPGCHEAVRETIYGEGRKGQGMVARPSLNRWPMWRSWAMIAGQPSSVRLSIAACNATAPTTFGEPASSRSGGSFQTTSSSSTRLTAPPPARKGSPSVKASRGPISTPPPKGAYILWPLPATKAALSG